MDSLFTPFLSLSYPTTTPPLPDSFHDSIYYETGPLDVCLIVSCIAVMAVLRDITRIYLLEPFAEWKLTRDWERLQREKITSASLSNGNGHLTLSKIDARKIHRSVLRFAEQGWSFIYYSLNFAFGLYVHHNLPTQVLHPTDLWLNYPHTPLAGTVKFYYLTQTAFYLHQVLILNAEARRKDHVQMMTHHIITIILMAASYAYSFTRIGCLIMVLMDCCDIFLPLAKMLRYIALYTLCDLTFTLFLLSWFITRHVLFIICIKSVMVDSLQLVPEIWAPEKGNYFSPWTQQTFSALLVALQVIQIIWFGMICRIAYRVVTGQGASDDRSDEEDEGTREKEE